MRFYFTRVECKLFFCVRLAEVASHLKSSLSRDRNSVEGRPMGKKASQKSFAAMPGGLHHRLLS